MALQRASIHAMLLGLLLRTVHAQNESVTDSSTTADPAEPSFFSTVEGPWLRSEAFCWSSIEVPTTSKIVHTTSDRSHPSVPHATLLKTKSTTKATQAKSTPARTNSDGTLIAVIHNRTVAYPTGYTTFWPSLTWSAILPTVTKGNPGSCCYLQHIWVPTPTHSPFLPDVTTIDAAHPKGFNHHLVKCSPTHPATLPSVFADQTLPFLYTGCPYTSCVVISILEVPAITPSPLPSLLVEPNAPLDSLVTADGSISTSAVSIPALVQVTTTNEETQQQTSTSQSLFLDQLPETTGIPQSFRKNPAELPASFSGQQSQEQPATIVPVQAASTTQKLASTMDPITAALPPITIGSAIITASSSKYLIDGQTLIPGSSITASGTTIQLAATPTELILGSTTIALASASSGGYVWTSIAATSSFVSIPGNSTRSPVPYKGEAQRLSSGWLGLVGVVLLLLC